MDSSDHRINVVYPAENGSFPLIAYAHGLDNDAGKDYSDLFSGLASFGYVITAHFACKEGCKDDRAGHWLDPPGFAHYYKQQLLAIRWAREQAASGNAVLRKVDFTRGVGIAGHSMGGQSTVYSSSYTNASAHNITAAVMHHAYTHEYPAPQVRSHAPCPARPAHTGPDRAVPAHTPRARSSAVSDQLEQLCPCCSVPLLLLLLLLLSLPPPFTHHTTPLPPPPPRPGGPLHARARAAPCRSRSWP